MTFRGLLRLQRIALRPVSSRSLPRCSSRLPLARFNSSTPLETPPSQPTDAVAEKESSDGERQTNGLENPLRQEKTTLASDSSPPDEVETKAPEVELGSDKPPAPESADYAKEQLKSFVPNPSEYEYEEEYMTPTSEDVTPTSKDVGAENPNERRNVYMNRLLTLHLPTLGDKKIPQWIGPDEFHTYIQPLYQRGWQIRFQEVSSTNVVSHVLSDRTFTVLHWNQANKFLNRMNDIIKQESHHPIAVKLSYEGKVVRLTVTLQTHFAMRNHWVGTRLQAPGITRLDIRFAVLLEQLYANHFGGGAPSVLPPQHRQPPINVIHKLLNVPPRKLNYYCTACGERHASGECSPYDPRYLRKSLPLCSKCHQRHAAMAVCPKTRDLYVLAPKTSCPNCGGNHWLQDCRKPQLPPDEAKALMIPLMPEMTLEK